MIQKDEIIEGQDENSVRHLTRHFKTVLLIHENESILRMRSKFDLNVFLVEL